MNELSQLISGLSVTHICDAVPGAKVLTKKLHAMGSPKIFIGTAFTIKSHGDLVPVMRGLIKAQPGDVLVIDSDESNKAVAGELFTREAIRKNLAGIVLHGYARDIDYIPESNFPFYAKGVNPCAGTKNQHGELQIPVSIENIVINPGDIIVGDINGIVVISPEKFRETIEQANVIKECEERAMDNLNNNKSIMDLFNIDEHISKLSKNEDSTLSWR